MLFNSYSFFLFFAVVLLIHYAMPFSWRAKKFNLLWLSYIFYAAWNPPFVILLWISTVMDWYLAVWLDRMERPLFRKLLVVASIVVNLGLLSFFKYGNFLLDNFVTLMSFFHIDYRPARPDIILPMGISFYTFLSLSYVIDVYRRGIRRWHSFLDYALYVTFFPHLVAGPILRASDFLPQCNEPRRATPRQMGWGLSLVVFGLFQKIVVADALLAPVAEAVYGGHGSVGFLSAWSATIAFAGQIFCDFAGYSTCAIGVALCLGFSLPDNFRCPYGAVGFSDFWRRWHISLSTWLRDYLYIPLGGNRRGTLRTYYNLMMTMLLGGLWHGASWTFVVWGGLHGLFLGLERPFREHVGKLRFAQHPLARVAGALLTFGLVCITWVFFRSRTFDQAFGIVRAMFGLTPGDADLYVTPGAKAVTALVMGSMLGLHWVTRDLSLEAIAERLSPWASVLILTVMIFVIFTMSGDTRAFIYFQF